MGNSLEVTQSSSPAPAPPETPETPQPPRAGPLNGLNITIGSVALGDEKGISMPVANIAEEPLPKAPRIVTEEYVKSLSELKSEKGRLYSACLLQDNNYMVFTGLFVGFVIGE